MKKNKEIKTILNFRFRLKPTSEQAHDMNKNIGCSRYIYNYGLDTWKKMYESGEKCNYNILQNLLPPLKKEHPFLKEADSTSLQSSLKDLERAFINFFDKRANYPNFKKKHGSKLSYRITMVNDNIEVVDDKFLKIPKIGLVRIKLHRQLPDGCKIKTTTIERKNNKYYATICIEFNTISTNSELDVKKSIGLDYSSSHFAISDDGMIIDNPKYFRINASRLARAQRKLSKKTIGSKSYMKQKTKVSSIFEHIANSRLDFLHKLSKSITDDYDYIFVEDINMKNISRTLNLGKNTMDNGYGMFREMLEYKSYLKNKVFLKVDKWYPSSKTCHVCNHKIKQLPLKVRTWTCPNCSTLLDRDINAAINIKKEGLRVLGLA